MTHETATNSLNGSASTGDKTERLTTALDLHKSPVSDVRGQGTRMAVALKMTLVLNTLIYRGSFGYYQTTILKC
jgi:hypothetical protein